MIYTDKEYYKLTEVADIIGVTRRTLYNYIKDRKIHASKIGGQWRVHWVDLKHFVTGVR